MSLILAVIPGCSEVNAALRADFTASSPLPGINCELKAPTGVSLVPVGLVELRAPSPSPTFDYASSLEASVKRLVILAFVRRQIQKSFGDLFFSLVGACRRLLHGCALAPGPVPNFGSTSYLNALLHFRCEGPITTWVESREFNKVRTFAMSWITPERP